MWGLGLYPLFVLRGAWGVVLIKRGVTDTVTVKPSQQIYHLALYNLALYML